MISTRAAVFALFALTAVPTLAEHDDEHEHAVLWTAYSAEYQAINQQIYNQATRDLKRLVADTSFSALVDEPVDPDKPPAVILDIDETVASGVDMEMTGVAFNTVRQYEWGLTHQTIPIRGAAEFVHAAEELGVEVFFVTNRPCEVRDDTTDPCIQEQGVVDLVAEIGIETDRAHVLMSAERPEWTDEKVSRRRHVAENYRVIMLFGDNYGDFITCTRAKPELPCTEGATRQSRHAALDTYKDYWGNGWYIFPNPLYGSWTSVK